jgi:hypothetical protein
MKKLGAEKKRREKILMYGFPQRFSIEVYDFGYFCYGSAYGLPNRHTIIC